MGDINFSEVDYWRSPEGLELLSCWARDGTIQDLYQRIGVSHSTFQNWRNKYPEINEAVKIGKEILDYRVENALIKSALGYKVTEVKTFISPTKDGNFKTSVEKIEKEIAPNVTACLAFLNNRKPEEWKRNRDNFFEGLPDDKNISIFIQREKIEKDEEEWDKVENVVDEDWDE